MQTRNSEGKSLNCEMNWEKLGQNCEMQTHNSEGKSLNCENNWEKLDQNCEKPQLPFLFFYSVAETGFCNFT